MAEYNGEVLFKQPKAAPAGSAAPNIVPIANGVDTTAAYAEEAKVAQDKLMADAEKARVESARILPVNLGESLKTNWEGILNSPEAAVTGAAALSVLGTGLYQLYGQDKKPGIKARMLSNQTPIDRTIDIPLDSTQIAKNFPAALSSTPNPLDIYAQQKHGFSLADIEANSGGAPLTKTTDIDIVANSMKNGRGISVNPLPGTVSNKPPGFPNAVSPLNQLTGGATPPAPIANAGTPSLTEAVSTGGDVTKALNENLAKDIDAETTKKVTSVSPDTAIKVEGLVRDAQGNFQYPPGMSPGAIQAHKAFVQQYPEIAASLEAQGKFGMVGGGAADNSLKNTYGVDLRKQILNEVNQGQMGGINKDYLEKINPAIKALSPETGLGKTLAELKINNPKGGIKGPLGVPATIGSSGELVSSPPGKVSGLINKGSKALLLMSMVDAANAAQKGNTAPAKEVGFDLASGYTLAKLLGGPAAAAAALALGSSGLNSNEQQDLEYRRRVGGGRGIAPPSAYFR